MSGSWLTTSGEAPLPHPSPWAGRCAVEPGVKIGCASGVCARPAASENAFAKLVMLEVEPMSCEELQVVEAAIKLVKTDSKAISIPPVKVYHD